MVHHIALACKTTMCALDLTCLDQVTLAFVLCDDSLSTRVSSSFQVSFNNPDVMITGDSSSLLTAI